MSISNSLYIGANGMMAHGDAISVVGDNIANASTIGYKRNRASFNDLLGGEVLNQRQGGGVYLGKTQTIWEQGQITQTNNPMDVAISGNGMFVVKGNHGGVDGQFYTRDGRFQLDSTGYMVNQQGQRVQGYPIGTDGARGASAGDLKLGGQQSPPVATTKAQVTMNLDSESTVPTVTPFDAKDAGSYNYATSFTVHDSLGAAHKVETFYVKNAAGGFDYHSMVDGGELAGGTAGTPTEIGTGTIQFDSDGKLMPPGTGTLTANFTNATAGQSIALDFGYGKDPASTSTANDSTIEATDVDGRSAGTLTDLSINPDGTVEGVYDNGDRIKVAQLAIADFTNQEGLERVGDGLMVATNDSGQALIDGAGTGSRGFLVSGALEASNVDLGTELVTLIAYQRAFQANSKTVTTADEMLTDVTNLKR